MMSETEEELMLYVEFNSMLHEDVLKGPNVQFNVIGFDSENPILQIGDEIYEGEYEDTSGTNVVFEEDTNHVPGDEVFAKDVPIHIRYSCKTNKILKMNRIFITEKNSIPTTITSQAGPKFAENYQDALIKLAECSMNTKTQSNINPKVENMSP